MQERALRINIAAAVRLHANDAVITKAAACNSNGAF
jgi:hypothetical protein